MSNTLSRPLPRSQDSIHNESMDSIETELRKIYAILNSVIKSPKSLSTSNPTPPVPAIPQSSFGISVSVVAGNNSVTIPAGKVSSTSYNVIPILYASGGMSRISWTPSSNTINSFVVNCDEAGSCYCIVSERA